MPREGGGGSLRYVNLLYVAALWTVCAWSSPVLAGTGTFDGKVVELVAGAYISVTILSLLGGIMRTLYRLNSNIVTVKSPLLELLANIFAGEIAGWLMYVFTSSMDSGPVLMIPGIFTASAAAPFFIQKWLPQKVGMDMEFVNHKDSRSSVESKDE